MAAAADALGAAAAAALCAQLGAAVTVTACTPLAGGASQEAWSVDALVAGQTAPLALVMRRDLGGAFTTLALSREREYAVLRTAFADGVRAPRPYAYAPDVAGRPALFMQRHPGEAVGRRVVTDPQFAAARAVLGTQLAQQLAAIHALDAATPALPQPPPGRAPSSAELDRLSAELDALDEPHPAIELGLRWLRRHDPGPPAELAFVHGDYRIGNVLVGPGGLEAILDWEFAHAGDPAEDAGWICVRAWRFGGTAGRVGGFAGRAAFLADYRAASGRALDPDRVNWWEVFGNVKWAIGALGQAHRHLSGVQPSIELASIGRLCAEMEYELLQLIV